MVDRIQKVLNKISDKDRTELLLVADDILKGRAYQHDVKKLKGQDNIYRVRKGKFRILYQLQEDGRTKIIAIERRDDNTYKNF